jgi:lysyl-tRNA synthetase class 1
MSKSLGNVITVPDMLKYMRPEHLRYWMFQGKLTIAKDINLKQMVPLLWNEFDQAERIYFKLESSGNERKDQNFRRAYELAVVKPKKPSPVHIPFEVMVEIVKILPEKNHLEFALKKLVEFKRIKQVNKDIEEEVSKRLEFAKRWYEDFLKVKVQSEKIKVDEKGKMAIEELIKAIEKEDDGEKLQKEIFEIAKRSGIEIQEFFKLIYKIILNSDRGPRLGPYIIESGKEEIIKKLRGVI